MMRTPQAKTFTLPLKTITKKALQSYKPMPEEKYTKEFKAVMESFDQVYRMAEDWMGQNTDFYAEIFKVQVIATDVSHHAVVWYN